MAYIEELFSDHFIQYASYVIRDRAIPSLSDGLKPVQRRILQSLWDMDDGKFHKVANVVGHCMQYHPHGDASIYGALVHLANKELLIEKQGNFGNLYTGDPASAARYIECRLSPLARQTLFNPEITKFMPSYDGRRNEPLAFPAKLPFLLIFGAEGIAVGMSTRVLPHNFGEVITAMCAELNGQNFELLPDFPTGGMIDASQYNKGNGKVLSRATMQCEPGQIIIRELPYGVTTESLIASLEAAVKKGRIRLQNIQNFTAEEVEIVLQLPRGVNAEEQMEALYAFSACEISISCNLLTIDEKRPIELDAEAIIRYSCKSLKQILKAELELEAYQLQQQIFSRTLERIFIEDRLYKPIEELTKLKEIEASILAGLESYCAEDGELGRPVTKEELAELLRIPIRRISLYDIERMQKELRKLEKRLRQVEKFLANLTKYALSYLTELQQEFSSAFPRKTILSSFAKVDARQVAKRDLTLRYDPQEGFLGYSLKQGLELFACSSYDRILLLNRKGSYSVFNVPEKLFVGKELLFCHLADKEELAKLDCAVFYRDEKTKYSYAKRIRFGGYILEKEYSIIPTGTALPESTPAPKTKSSAAFTLQYFVAINNKLTTDLQELQHKLRKTDKGSKEEAILKEYLQTQKHLPNVLAQPNEYATAFAILFSAIATNKDKTEKQKTNQLWHYCFNDLPEKAVKAKGQLLCPQRVQSIKPVRKEKFDKLMASGKNILAPDFPPPKRNIPADEPTSQENNKPKSTTQDKQMNDQANTKQEKTQHPQPEDHSESNGSLF